ALMRASWSVVETCEPVHAFRAQHHGVPSPLAIPQYGPEWPPLMADSGGRPVTGMLWSGDGFDSHCWQCTAPASSRTHRNAPLSARSRARIVDITRQMETSSPHGP